jgi:hypothetical protein
MPNSKKSAEKRSGSEPKLLSGGNPQIPKERVTSRLLSASVTCRLRKQSLFALLTDVLNASIRGDPIPALA